MVERLKWNSYESKKGTKKDEAREEFISGAKKMLTDAGFSYENPEKAKIEETYSKCVDKKLSLGLSLDEIQRESNKFEII